MPSRALRAVRPAAAAVLLAGPTALAFFSGGFFERPRIVAGITAWALVALAALVGARCLPRALPGRLALAGLAGLTAWVAASIAWAGLAGPATDDLQRTLLYLGAFVAAGAWLADPAARRAVEPALALGAAVVCCYALSERLLPGLVDLDASATARGRLEQPLTYWNGMGVLAAIGLVLCARVAGDPTRATALRSLGAAAAVPAALALYLTFSRGALGAAAVGAIVLVALAPGPAQLRAVGITAAAGLVVAVLAGLLPGVRGEEPDAGVASLQGALMLVALAGLALGAAALQARLAARGRSAPEAAAAGDGRRRLAALLAAGAVVGAMVFAAAAERSSAPAREGSGPSRLASIESIRPEYWQVAASAFASQPLRGVGSGGFLEEWRRERDVPERANDAHSLYLEVAAELGVVGLALLGLLVGGAALTVVRAGRARLPLAAGAGAVLAAWAAAAAVDWHWEMPAVTLPPLIALAALVAANDELAPEPR